MKNSKYVLVATLSSFIFSGCATLFGGGGDQVIYIDSDKPYKGKIYHIDKPYQSQEFISPDTMYIERRNKDILITSPDKEFETILVESNVNNWFWLNFAGFIYGSYSSTTDFVTGAAWKYDEVVNIDSK